MGDDRYDDSAVLCQFHVLEYRVVSSSVPILLPLIETLFFATCSACLGSSKGTMSTPTVPNTSLQGSDRRGQPRSCDSDTEGFVSSIRR